MITGKFVGIADNGKIQVRIKGISNVQFDIDSKYVFAMSLKSPRSPVESNTKSITHPEPVGAQPDPEPEPEYEEEPEQEPGIQDDVKVAADEPPQEIKENGVMEEPETVEGPGAPNEKFHPKHKFKSMVVEQDGFVLKTTESKSVMCGFGSYECAVEGYIYHWKLKVLEGDTDVNIGVIWSETARKNRKQMWWLADEGYSYWGLDGQKYHSDKYKAYGEEYGQGDEIDVWLNLKKYNVSFAKNGNNYGKAFKVDKTKTYRLGVGFNGNHAVELLEFSIE